MEDHKSIETAPAIEVFKTDVIRQEDADRLVKVIHATFTDYQANFDLEDCDHILRVKSYSDIIIPTKLVLLLNTYGFNAEVLTDS